MALVLLRPSGRRRRIPPFLGRGGRGWSGWSGRRLARPKSVVGLLILLGIAILAARLGGRAPWWGAPRDPNESFQVQVWRVIDGDTLELADGTKVRLIGVDAPELPQPGQPAEPFAWEATRFTEQFLAGGPVWLQLDPHERWDRYGRRLAYLWVGDRMLNEQLLLAGLARARLEFRYSEAMKQRFAQAEAHARQARRGLWALSAP
ncbi:MAG: thermonuclease family protein [Thermoguttaceae bacterium]|nr:thermonuclease family protein [Thermoguttaceae bacterium]MDW8039169.1 thermonuclease family protein [Thermoguttaceae bacterium]